MCAVVFVFVLLLLVLLFAVICRCCWYCCWPTDSRCSFQFCYCGYCYLLLLLLIAVVGFVNCCCICCCSFFVAACCWCVVAVSLEVSAYLVPGRCLCWFGWCCYLLLLLSIAGGILEFFCVGVVVDAVGENVCVGVVPRDAFGCCYWLSLSVF